MTIKKNKRFLWASIAGFLILLIGGIGYMIITEPRTEIDKFRAILGSDVTAVNEHGMTLLHLAICNVGGNCEDDSWDIEVIKWLVAEGADVNAKTKHDATPLQDAIARQNMELIEFLVSKGADVNFIPRHGTWTPLHSAVSIANLEIVKFLISAGANVNAANASGYTPLHWTASLCWTASGLVPESDEAVAIAEFLVSQGADVNAKNEDGKTPLDLANENGKTATAAFLSSVR